MRDDLRAAVDALAAAESLLVATDFDGVLAPLVDDPMSSRPLPGTVEALRALSRMPGTTVAAVSGRDLGTLGHLSGLGTVDEGESIVLVGSHGAQVSDPEVGGGHELSEPQAVALAALDEALTAIVAAHPGTRIERKPAAVVLHTRGVDQPVANAATAATVAMAAGHSKAHVMPGKCVVELSVVDADKGSAIRDLASWCGATAVYYAGDDVTDERAFAAMASDGREGDLTLKVGPGDTAARHRVDSPEDAAEVLLALTEARSRHTTA
ncbi:trehalose-phosphatase [Arsenicicoccus dermatophilus]|uniref:trehalose-phosphatase n=1 Tax=Arsenicicoccus dermatophilus TaxID=1076331 RepID=UPI001F4C74BD|nr:trehalose-phosphatase [Arsenicicoccus dermatophilus]MCH8612003.1 trehalose-phosphatase [Arsenicicoccus dermatophilus]